MQFTLKTTVNLAIDPRLTWMIYSEQTRSFLVGDGKKAFSLAVDQPVSPNDITGSPASDSCNLPISAALYDEFRQTSWHGFRFLDAASDLRVIARHGLEAHGTGEPFEDRALESHDQLYPSRAAATRAMV